MMSGKLIALVSTAGRSILSLKEQAVTRINPMILQTASASCCKPCCDPCCKPCCSPCCEPCCDFTPAEVMFYYKQFTKHDPDKDGIITRWAMNDLYKERFGRQLNSDDFEKMWRRMNVRYCDDKVYFSQYMNHLQKRFDPVFCLQELIVLFDMWDTNNDGTLDLWEFRKFIGYIGYDPDHPDLTCHFQKSDRDSDDFINFEEFLEAYENLPCLCKRCA